MVSPEQLLAHYAHADQTSSLREHVLREVGQTYRSIPEYAIGFGFREEEFIDLLRRSQRVADVGAGYMGLAIETYLRQIKCEVYSINPQSELADFKPTQLDKALKEIDPQLQTTRTNQRLVDDIVGAQSFLFSHHRVSPLFAHEFPFDRMSFDAIFDYNGAFYFMREQELDFLELYVRNAMGSLKRGGSLYVHHQVPHDELYKKKLGIVQRLGYVPEKIGWSPGSTIASSFHNKICGFRATKR